MGLFSSKTPEQKAARQEAVTALNTAQSALNTNSEQERRVGIRDETPEYLVLNAAADEAHKNPDLPWYRRG